MRNSVVHQEKPPSAFHVIVSAALLPSTCVEWNCRHRIVRAALFSRSIAVNQTTASSSGNWRAAFGETLAAATSLSRRSPASSGCWTVKTMPNLLNYELQDGKKTQRLELCTFPSIVCSCLNRFPSRGIWLVDWVKQRLKMCPRRSWKKKNERIISTYTKCRCRWIDK